MAVTVTLIILILVLPGCNQKTKRIENTLRVSVVTYTHDDPFINATVDELKEELKKRETEEEAKSFDVCEYLLQMIKNR